MVDIGLEEKFDFVFIFLGFAFGGNSKLWEMISRLRRALMSMRVH